MTCLEDIPRLPIDDALEDPNRDEDNENPDKRRPMRLLDALVQRDDEFSDSEDEGEGGRRDRARHRDTDGSTKTTPKRFGVGVGIMGAAPPGVGSAATQPSAAVGGSGGPSAHSPVVEALARRKETRDDMGAREGEPSGEDMDVDSDEKVDAKVVGAATSAGLRESPMDVETPEPPASTEKEKGAKSEGTSNNIADTKDKDDKLNPSAADGSGDGSTTSVIPPPKPDAAPISGDLTASGGDSEKEKKP